MKTLTLIFFVLIFSQVQAQQEAFMVIGLNYGRNYSDASNKLLIGKLLYTNDILTIPKEGYVSLMSPSGKVLEIVESGSYQITSLMDIDKQDSFQGVFKKKRNSRYLHVTGSVTQCMFYPVKFLSTKSSKFLNTKKLELSWVNLENHKSKDTQEKAIYQLSVYNDFDELIHRYETQDTSLQINFNNDVFQKQIEDGMSIFKLTIDNSKWQGENDLIALVLNYDKQDLEHRSEILEELKRIDTAYSKSNQIYRQLRKAFYLEANRYCLDAHNILRMIYQENSNKLIFRDAYLLFLLRQNILNLTDLEAVFGIKY